MVAVRCDIFGVDSESEIVDEPANGLLGHSATVGDVGQSWTCLKSQSLSAFVVRLLAPTTDVPDMVPDFLAESLRTHVDMLRPGVLLYLVNHL